MYTKHIHTQTHHADDTPTTHVRLWYIMSHRQPQALMWICRLEPPLLSACSTSLIPSGGDESSGVMLRN